MTLRLTWVQPEDLVGHELWQLALEGYDVGAVRERWLAAGGRLAPARGGASGEVVDVGLRRLALQLLDELSPTPPLPETGGAAPGPQGRPPAVGPTGWAGSSSEPPGWAGHPGAAPPGPPHPSFARIASNAGGAGYRAERARPQAPDGLTVAPRPKGADPGRGAKRCTGAGQADVHRLHAAWLGRAVGCLLGKPVEKVSLDGIRALARAAGNWPIRGWFTERGVPQSVLRAYPWNRRSAGNSLAENISQMPEDDDLNYPLLNLRLLQRHGKAFTTGDVARLWLDELPAGRTFTAERVAYRNLLAGIEPPHTARHHNPFREWIGALIRADLHGWTNPGQPERAAEQARRDARLSHTGNGVHGAEFVAAALAVAATGADVHRAIEGGLAVVPPDSRLYAAIVHARELAAATADFDAVVDTLHRTHARYHWVHVIPNVAALTAALTHADGDFTLSVTGAVSAGWDTDSNGATAGSIAGLIAGHPDRIPAHWTDPLHNRLATTVPGFDGIGFDTLAQLTLQEAERA